MIKILHSKELSFRLLGVIAFLAMFMVALMMYADSFKVEWLFKAFYLFVVVVIFATRKNAPGVDIWSPRSAVIYAHCLIPLFATKGGMQLIDGRICYLLAFIGLVISAFALTDLWEAFGILPANRGIVVRGLYRFDRR